MSDERENLPSASSIERFIRCPGSHQFIKSVTQKAKQIEDETASEGTLIHKALETDDYSDLSIEQADIAESIKDQRDALAESFKMTYPKALEIREERFWILSGGVKVFSAKPDYVLIGDDAALCIDYKTTFNSPSPAHTSWQARAQALALYQEFGHSHKFKKIIVSIAHARFGKHMSLSQYTEEDLGMAMAQLKAAVWAAAQDDAQRVPGLWCKFCPAATLCRERAAWCLLPSSLVAEGPLTIQDMAVIERRRKEIEKLTGAVTRELRAYGPEELAKVGLKLEPNSPRRKVVSVPRLAEALEKKTLCAKELVYEKASISIGEINKLIKPKVKLALAAVNLPSKDIDVVKHINGLLADYVEETVVEPSVVEIG